MSSGSTSPAAAASCRTLARCRRATSGGAPAGACVQRAASRKSSSSGTTGGPTLAQHACGPG
jgi:hypothetical protein